MDSPLTGIKLGTRRLSPDPETIGVPSGGFFRQAIPIGAVGVVELNSERSSAMNKTKSWKVWK
jgi:hypothetical protein